MKDENLILAALLVRYCIDTSNFIYLCFFFSFFLERVREKEREGEKRQCEVASRVPPTGDLVGNPGMCPDWKLNWRPFDLQASTQSTEPHQPGLYLYS